MILNFEVSDMVRSSQDIFRDVDHMEDSFDRGSEQFDDGREPPGWATRNGFAVRIISRSSARYSASEAMVRDYLSHPAEKCPTRDAFIELSRAFPPYSSRKKRRLCEKMSVAIPNILRASASLMDGMPDASLDDFQFAMRAGRNHPEWDCELCAHCQHTRSQSVSFVVMSPCGHVLCLSSGCLGDDRGCPICIRDALLDGIEPSKSRAIAIDTTLAIPAEILLACVAATR